MFYHDRVADSNTRAKSPSSPVFRTYIPYEIHYDIEDSSIKLNLETKEPDVGEEQTLTCSKVTLVKNADDMEDIVRSVRIKGEVDSTIFGSQEIIWFTLTCEENELQRRLKNNNNLLAPPFSQMSRQGSFRFQESLDFLLDQARIVLRSKKVVIKVLGTKIYNLEIIHSLIICDEGDERYSQFPNLEEFSECNNSTIKYTAREKGNVIQWLCPNIFEDCQIPWYHLNIGVATKSMCAIPWLSKITICPTIQRFYCLSNLRLSLIVRSQNAIRRVHACAKKTICTNLLTRCNCSQDEIDNEGRKSNEACILGYDSLHFLRYLETVIEDGPEQDWRLTLEKYHI